MERARGYPTHAGGDRKRVDCSGIVTRTGELARALRRSLLLSALSLSSFAATAQAGPELTYIPDSVDATADGSATMLIPVEVHNTGTDTLSWSVRANALHFDGVDGRVEIPDGPGLDLVESLDRITIEAWIRVEDWTNEWVSVVAEPLKKKDFGWTLQIHRNSGVNWISYPDGVFFPWVPAPGVWHHLAFTYDAEDGFATLVADGTAEFTQPFQAGILDTDGEPLYLGYNPSGGDEYSHGAVHDLRVWSAVRTFEEIRENRFTRFGPDTPDLVGYWPLDEGDGTIVHDLSAFAVDGTLHGGASWGSSLPSWLEVMGSGAVPAGSFDVLELLLVPTQAPYARSEFEIPIQTNDPDHAISLYPVALTRDWFATDAVSREASVFTKRFSFVTSTDAVSREFSAFNKVFSIAPQTDATSREFSVFSIPPQLGTTDAVSREFTAFNKVFSTAPLTDAISREFSVFAVPEPPLTLDAISREFSVFNKVFSTASLSDANSREFSVFMSPFAAFSASDAIAREFSVFTDASAVSDPGDCAGGPILFTWTPVSSANAYRIDLATEPTEGGIFNSIFLPDTTSYRFAGPLTEGVTYYARVAPSLDGGNTYGDPGLFSNGVLVDLTAPVADRPEPSVEDVVFVTLQLSGEDNFGIDEYFVQVDITDAFQDPLLEVSVPADLAYVEFVGTAGVTYYARVRASDCAENIGEYSAVSVFQLGEPPNLVVTEVDAATEGLTGYLFPVEYTVRNVGNGTAYGPWKDRVLLSRDPEFGNADDIPLDPVIVVPGPLEPGPSGEYFRAGSFYLPTEPDTYWVAVETDWEDQVEELDGDGNDNRLEAPEPVVVLPAPLPNFEVDDLVDVVGPVQSGSNISFRYTVRNTGTGATETTSWTDAFFLLRPSEVDPFQTDGCLDGYTLLGTQGVSVHLEPNATYTRDITVRLPGDIEGVYLLAVRTDHRYDACGACGPGRRCDVAELDERDNHYIGDAFQILLGEQPDLIVDGDGLVTPTKPSAGFPLTAAYDVRNQGDAVTDTGAWVDEVYLSTDTSPSISTSDVLIGTKVRQAPPLDAGDNSSEETAGRIPYPLFGVRNVKVRLDATNLVSEAGGGEFNNVAVVYEDLEITPTGTFDIYPTSIESDSTGSAGQLASVAWSVATDELFTLPEFEQSWYDSIYVSIDPTLSPDDIPVAGFRQSTHLQEDGSYAVENYSLTRQVRLPSNLTDGEYFLVLHANASGGLFEYQDSLRANVLGADRPIRVDTRLANLVPDTSPDPARAFPDTVYAGERAELTWRVQNDGEIVTPVDHWWDRVHLSTVPGLQSDHASWVLIEERRQGALEPSTRYQKSKQATVPLVSPGSYYWVVQADARSGVLESDEDDNLVVLPVHVTSDRPDLVPDSLFAPLVVEAGTALSVEWVVSNAGTIASDAEGWRDEVGLIDSSGGYTPIGQASFAGVLTPGESYARVRNFTAPTTLAGAYTVSLRLDVRHGLYELNEGNNRLDFATQIEVLPALEPDLDVTQLVSDPGPILSGQTLDAEWVVANVGAGDPRVETRRDRAYLSRDQFFDSQFDLYLGEVVRPNPGAGEADSASHRFDVPLGPQGPYFLILRADATGALPESDESNNSAIAGLIEFVLPDSADLSFESAVATGPVLAGEEFEFTWTARNDGENTVLGRWFDDVYLSEDTILDPEDARIGSFQNDPGGIPPGESREAGATARVPAVVPGDYFLIADLDVRNEIPETDESNNTGPSLQPVRVDLVEIPVGDEIVDLAVPLERNRYYQVVAEADSALTIECEGHESDWIQLYVALDRIPTQGSFDYAATAYGRNRQEIEVPRTEDGSYFVLARRARGPEAADLRLAAAYTPFALTSVTPGVVGSGIVTFLLEGSRWGDQTTFRLVRGLTSFDPIEIVPAGSGRVRARFDLDGAPLGLYDMEALDPNAGAAVLEEAVRVERASGLEGDLAFDLGPAVRKGTSSRSQLVATNRSNVDVDAMLLFTAISADPDARISLPVLADTFATASQRIDLRQSLILRSPPGEIGSEALEAFASRSFPDSSLTVGYNAAFMTEDGVTGYLTDLLSQLRFQITGDPLAPPEVLALALSESDWSDAMDQGIANVLGVLMADYGRHVSICALVDQILEEAFAFAGLTEPGELARTVSVPCCEDPCACFPESFACELYCSLTDDDGGGCPTPEFSFGEIACRGDGCVQEWPAVAADDPNEKGGERGYGPENWVGIEEPIRYRIYFENVPEASAPASRVVVVDELQDVDFNPGSFIPTAFNIAGTTYEIPGRNPYYYERIDLTETRGVFVDVTGRIDVSEDPPRIEWFFQTIDPATGRPPTDPQRGFLPPNVEAPEGQAFVEFLLQANEQVASASILENTAGITFDQNEAIDTNFLRYTVDGDVPFSSVASLPDTIYATTFNLSWSGEDPSGASGLKSYSLYVSRNGGPFALEAGDLEQTQYVFTGEPGLDYGFYTIAVDNAGNRELEKFFPDATVHVGGVLSVWPGDTDNDGVVTEMDVLPLGIHFDQEGPPRADADRNWSEQFSEAWTPYGGTFADADGDGMVDESDLIPIGLNFGLSHDGGSALRPLGRPVVGDEFTVPPEAAPGSAAVPFSTGPSSVALTGEENQRVVVRWDPPGAGPESGTGRLDGFSFAVEWSEAWALDSLLIADAVGAVHGVRFERQDDSSRRAFFGFSALAPGGAIGSGDLATLVFRPSGASASDMNGQALIQSLQLVRSSIRQGDEILSGGLTIGTAQSTPLAFFALPPQPNPSSQQFVIRFGLPEQREVQIDVFDVGGRRVLRPLERTVLEAGWHSYRIPVETLASGVYFSRLRAGNDERSAKVVVVK